MNKGNISNSLSIDNIRGKSEGFYRQQAKGFTDNMAKYFYLVNNVRKIAEGQIFIYHNVQVFIDNNHWEIT